MPCVLCFKCLQNQYCPSCCYDSPCCIALFLKLRQLTGKTISLLFSHLGLCALVAGYAAVGAITFKAIEGPEEQKRLGHIQNDTEAIATQIVEWARQNDYYDEDSFMKFAESVLKDFELKVVHAVTLEGYNGVDEDVTPQWTFSGALLYSFTVITTIGYGHIVPMTKLGRMTTVLYATIGIPLMLMCLANIAETLAQMFTFIYFRICCAYCRWKELRRIRLRRAATMTAKNYIGAVSLKRGMSMRSTTRPAQDRYRERRIGGSFRRDVEFRAPKKHSTFAAPKMTNDAKWETRSLPGRKPTMRRQNTVAAPSSRTLPRKSIAVKKSESMKSPSHHYSPSFHGAIGAAKEATESMKRQLTTVSNLLPHRPSTMVWTHPNFEKTESNPIPGGSRRSKQNKDCKCIPNVCFRGLDPSPAALSLDPSPATTETKSMSTPRQRFQSGVSLGSDLLQVPDESPMKEPLSEQYSLPESNERAIPQIVVSDPMDFSLHQSTSAMETVDTLSDDEETVDSVREFSRGGSYTSRTQETVVMIGAEDRSLVTMASRRSSAPDMEDEKMPVSVWILTLVGFISGGDVYMSADTDEKSLRSNPKSIRSSAPDFMEDGKTPVSVGILTLVGFILGGDVYMSAI